MCVTRCHKNIPIKSAEMGVILSLLAVEQIQFVSVTCANDETQLNERKTIISGFYFFALFSYKS